MIDLKEIIFLVVFIAIFGGAFVHSALINKKNNRPDDQVKKKDKIS